MSKNHKDTKKGQMKGGLAEQKHEPFEIIHKPDMNQHEGKRFHVEPSGKNVGLDLDKQFQNLSYNTRVIHVGQEPELFDYNAVVPPMVLSTSFERCPMMNIMDTRRTSGGSMTGTHDDGKKIHGEEPGIMQRITETITGKDVHGDQRATDSNKGIMGRITESLMSGTTIGEQTGRTQPGKEIAGSPESKGVWGKPSGKIDTTGTGSPEAKGVLGKGQVGSPSLQNPADETGETTTTGGTSDTRGGIHGMGRDIAIQRTTPESGIGTFASTYESTFPARGIGHLPILGLETHYGRMGNPTRKALESSLATLENAKYALAFPSGTSVLATCGFLLESGNHVLVLDEVYSDTAKFFRDCATRMGVEVSFVDMTDLTLTGGAMQPNTTMVWIETPTNPSLKLVDINGVADIVRRTNPNTIIIVDSTVASPIFQSPLKLGADIVLHSLTKHINGHYDVVMGSLMTNRKDLIDKMALLQDVLGCVPSPFDCYLVNRSIKTYPLRMKEQMNSAMKIATNLQNHPAVSRLMYPGLSTHPHNHVFKKQMSGFGGVITFKLHGNQQDVDSFMSSLKLFSCAANMGGYVSLVDQPSINEHHKEGDNVNRNLDPTLIRLSIGLEDSDDLLNDLLTALEKVRHTDSKSTGIGSKKENLVKP